MRLVEWVTVFLAWGMSMFMAATFYQAYMHPSKAVIVYVDKHGEAWWEAILVGLLIIFVTVGSVCLLRRLLDS